MNRSFAGISAMAWLGLLILLVGGWFTLGALPAATVAVLVVGLYYGIAGASFNFLYGSLHIFSLAQSVFLAVGGFTTIYLGKTYGVTPWLSLLIAPVIAAIIALPIGLAAVRAGTGAVLTALITLIISQAIPPILISIQPLGGAVGLYADIKAEPSFWDMQFIDGKDFAKLFLVLNVIVIGFVLWWNRSRFGFYTTAIKDSPNASAAMGVPNGRMRIITFMIGAAIAAPAGVVFAQYNLLATADLFLGATALFQVIVVALVGGAARPWGALVGSVLIVWLSNQITDLANGKPGIGPLTFAGVFVLMALVLPRGISGTWAAVADKRKNAATGALSRVELLEEQPGSLADPSTHGEALPTTPEPRA
jgi:branched-chain amino acid transport system permease protein